MVYVRWGETARIDYFRALGFFSSEDDKMKTGIILGFQSVKYIAPVTYPIPSILVQNGRNRRTESS
jgi:acyl-CoA thioester hydrolase